MVETAAFGRPNEAQLVDALRAADTLTLSAVAEVKGQIVGHVAYSPVKLGDDRSRFDALALAPMAVFPQWQRRGIGTVLLRWSLDECRRGGHRLVIVVGLPEYYPRFGFVRATPLGLRCPFEVPNEAFMLLELQPGALAGRKGIVRFRPEFKGV